MMIKVTLKTKGTKKFTYFIPVNKISCMVESDEGAFIFIMGGFEDGVEINESMDEVFSMIDKATQLGKIF